MAKLSRKYNIHVLTLSERINKVCNIVTVMNLTAMPGDVFHVSKEFYRCLVLYDLIDDCCFNFDVPYAISRFCPNPLLKIDKN